MIPFGSLLWFGSGYYITGGVVVVLLCGSGNIIIVSCWRILMGLVRGGVIGLLWV